MTEQQTDQGQAAGGGEAGRVASIGEQLSQLKDEILGEVKQLIGGAKTAEGKAQGVAQQHEADKLNRPSEAGDNLGALVDQAVNRVLGARDAKAADDAHAAQHAKLEAAAAERTPVERTRRHKLMGWGEPE